MEAYGAASGQPNGPLLVGAVWLERRRSIGYCGGVAGVTSVVINLALR